MTKVYYSPTSSIKEEYYDVVGLIENVNSRGIRNRTIEKIKYWCLDSGTFTKNFNKEAWRKRVIEYIPYIENCSFVVVPDVVYDYQKTLERFYDNYRFLKKHGFPCAFVTQDKIDIESAPFELFDVLFVGGSNNHKLGAEARNIIEIAKKKNKLG